MVYVNDRRAAVEFHEAFGADVNRLEPDLHG
jgi:hypothetical protein